MTGRPVTAIISALVAIAMLASVAGAATKRFEGKGVAPLSGYDVNSSRKLAAKRGVRAAVEDATGSLLNGKVFADNYEKLDKGIFDHSKKYVTESMILTEARQGDNYEVTVWAEVEMDKLKASLIDMGLLLPREKMPMWMVVVTEKWNDSAPQSAWINEKKEPSLTEKYFGDMIDDYGYRLYRPVDADSIRSDTADGPLEKVAKLITAASESGADYLLVGECHLHTGEGVTNPDYQLGTVTLKLKLYNVSTSEQVGESETRVSLELPESKDNYNRFVMAACNRLTDDVTAWMQSVNPSGAAGFVKVSLKLYGFTNYDEYSRILRTLERDIKGVRRVTLVGIETGSASLDVFFSGDADELAQQLVSSSFDGFYLNFEGLVGGKYIIQVIPRP